MAAQPMGVRGICKKQACQIKPDSGRGERSTMPYVAKWSDLPEVEILKGNFRRSASGLKGSVNKIRLSHPSETPVHHHAEEEQTVLMLSGEMDVVIDKDTIRLGPDQVCVIPAGVPHCFRSIAGEAVFLETFSPGRIQNLIGFLGKVF
jgi:mannose-6-phosphate isomerase-like protein (cupin superfamily)